MERLPVWLEVLGNHHSWLNDPSLLGELCPCEGLYKISILNIPEDIQKLTVESLLSPIFLPTNFWVHSSVFEFSLSPELIPGTTRGILRVVFVLKGFVWKWYFVLEIGSFDEEVYVISDEEHNL